MNRFIVTSTRAGWSHSPHTACGAANRSVMGALRVLCELATEAFDFCTLVF